MKKSYHDFAIRKMLLLVNKFVDSFAPYIKFGTFSVSVILFYVVFYAIGINIKVWGKWSIIVKKRCGEFKLRKKVC